MEKQLAYINAKWSDLTASLQTDRERLRATLQPFGIATEQTDLLLADLVKAHTGPGRCYHSLGHTRRMLTTIDQLSDLADDLPAIQLAAWFHDSVYDNHTNDNHIQSAAYAVARLRVLRLPGKLIKNVERRILYTRHDIAKPVDMDSQILRDADLEAFGTTPEEYHRDAIAIRWEYGWMPEAAYRQQRIGMLRGLLERERLFFTAQMFLEWEVKARQNIADETEDLENKLAHWDLAW